MKISRIILIILLFFVFFEIGLFSSYTLATGEVPDPGELINMQRGGGCRWGQCREHDHNNH